MKTYNLIDLFCGAGGMSVGYEQTGKFKTILGLDHDAAASGTFKLNNPKTAYIKANICYVTSDHIYFATGAKKGQIDLIIGGTPCQGFSTLGKRLVDDPRNLLFCEFARLVKEVEPKMFILENVGGMKSMKSADDNIVYNMVRTSFRKIGYDVRSYLLNAANFGVPQERKRLFFIGCRYRDIKFPEPAFTHYLNGQPVINIKGEKLVKALTVMEAISDLPELKCGQSIDYYNKPENEYQKFMRNYGSANEVKKLTLHHCGSYSKKLELIMKTIPPGSGKTIWELIDEDSFKVPKEAIPTSGFKNTYARLVPDKPSMTITRNFGCISSSRCIHPFQNRGLSPREAARIQSFKDDFVFVNKDVWDYLYEEKIERKQSISEFASFVPNVDEKGPVYIFKGLHDKEVRPNLDTVKIDKNKNGISLLIGNAVPPLLAKAVSQMAVKMLDEIYEKEKLGEIEKNSLTDLTNIERRKEFQPHLNF